jgi:serine protease
MAKKEIRRPRVYKAPARRWFSARPEMGSPEKGERPSGMIVIRLTPEANPARQEKPANTLEEHAKMNGLMGLSRFLSKVGETTSHRLVRTVPVEKLLAMEEAAANTKYPPLHSMTQYWRLDTRGRPREEVRAIIEELLSLPEVDSAWEEMLPTLPVVNPGDDPYNTTQNYQDAAPTGIDARWMWTQPNGEGTGIGVIDIEGGWRVTHEDLVGKSPTLVYGAQYASWEDHGTAVLGEILATDNTVGVVGTAPAINNIRMCSIFDASGVSHVTDAFAAAVAAASVGQIILIELQISFLPMETLDDILDIIRLATALGITVVEAAGNGNYDLDAWTTGGGLHRLNRTSPDFVESGAIMVGASVSAVPHERAWFSNYGSRIDCFAWGENVTTTGYGDLDNGGGNADKYYTNTFGGTSSASPIIVSAAALVQSCYHATTGTLLSPGQLRAILSDPATGTPQGGTVAGAIGVMPDLNLVIPALGLVPDVYLRDAVGDVGIIPWTGSISCSPDVITRPTAVADPQATYGEGSGTENSNTLGYEVEYGQQNYIYVRVRNRGATTAANVIARVYWSEVATLITPSSWHLVGSVTIPSVPVGDILTVSDAIPWPSASIPATGHYCFVATLEHPNDPAPPTPDSLVDWSNFTDFIRNHNNVTWRNFNVVNLIPPSPTPPTPATPQLAPIAAAGVAIKGGVMEFPFKMAGADDRAVDFEFEVERRLPADAVLEFEGPPGLMARLRGGRQMKLTRVAKQAKEQLSLPALPRVRLEETRLNKRDRIPCALRLRLGKEKLVPGHGFAIRQLYQGKEVGRINWQFALEARPEERIKDIKIKDVRIIKKKK